jgi:hypothetical protein
MLLVRPVALRGEEAPGSAVVVLRGGVNGLAPETVAGSAGRNLEAFGFLGLSVFLALDRTVEEPCSEVSELARQWPGPSVHEEDRPDEPDKPGRAVPGKKQPA